MGQRKNLHKANVDLLLHIIKNEASLSREQLLKLQGFVSALEAENK